MKAREGGGVVDSQLNVYGVKGLKVADISIAPGNVGSVSTLISSCYRTAQRKGRKSTYSTALTIGEKAAPIIASELRMSGV